MTVAPPTSTDVLTDLELGPAPLVAGPDDPPHRHVRARLDAQLRVLLDHEEGTRAGTDPEDLHQMRVTVRRLRAAIKADGAALGERRDRLDAELKWLGNALGPVRDLDVQLARLRAEAADFAPDERAAVERLLRVLVAERAAARRRMLAALRGKRYRTLLVEVAEAARSAPVAEESGPDEAPQTAMDLVRRPYRKLRRAVLALDADPPDDDLHALRIKGKRLRYAAEMAGSSRKRVRRLIAATKRFQDVLGEHQDAVIAEQRIRRLLDDRDDVDPGMAFAAGRLVERERRRRAEYRARWRETWAEVDACARALL